MDDATTLTPAFDDITDITEQTEAHWAAERDAIAAQCEAITREEPAFASIPVRPEREEDDADLAYVVEVVAPSTFDRKKKPTLLGMRRTLAEARALAALAGPSVETIVREVRLDV